MGKRGFLTVTLVAIILFSFQNCGQQSSELGGSAEEKSAKAEALTASLMNEAPFPFEAQLTHLSHMSCNSNGSNEGAYLFKGLADADSASPGGLRINPDFILYIQNKLPQRDPKTAAPLPLTAEYLTTLIKGNKLFDSAGLFFSLRSISSPQKPLYDDSFVIDNGGSTSAFKENAPYIFDTITSDTVLNRLISQALNNEEDPNLWWMDYMPHNSLAMRNFTATWNPKFPKPSLEEALTNLGYLGLVFSSMDESGNETQAIARGPALSGAAYGTGYKINLRIPYYDEGNGTVTNFHTSTSARVIDSIDEIDLSNSLVKSNSNPFVCDKKYLIVDIRDHNQCPDQSTYYMSVQMAYDKKLQSLLSQYTNPTDAQKTAASSDAATFAGTFLAQAEAGAIVGGVDYKKLRDQYLSEITNELAIARKFLPESEWFVHPVLKCVVPKLATNCYPTDAFPGTSTPPRVNYDGTTKCGHPSSVNYITGESPGLCPQYVTFCSK